MQLRQSFKVSDAADVRCPFGKEFEPPLAFCIGKHCAAFEMAEPVIDEEFRIEAANPGAARMEQTRLQNEGWHPFEGPRARTMYGVPMDWWRGKAECGRCAR